MNQSVTTLVLLSAGLIGIACLLLAVASLVPAVSRPARAAWPEVFIALLVYTIVMGAFFTGGTLLMALFVLLAFRTSYEAIMVGLARNPDYPSATIMKVALVFGGITAIATIALSLLPFSVVLYAAPLALLLALGVLVLRKGQSASTINIFMEVLVFPTLPVLVFGAAGMKPHYSVLLLSAFMMVETFDSYALLGGKLFGRRKAFPHLSPKKTIEGLAAGATMLVATAWLVGTQLMNFSLQLSILVALLAGFLAVVGDLAASRLKRRSGVKDFPVVLPYQGGVLDITDAWIVAGSGITLLSCAAGYG